MFFWFFLSTGGGAGRLVAGPPATAVLQVDGGINRETIGEVWRAGADNFVAGNAVFASPDPRAEIAALRARCAHLA